MDDRVENELKRGLESANQLRVLFTDHSRQKNRQVLIDHLNHHSSVVLDTFESAISMLKDSQSGGWNHSDHAYPVFDHSIGYDNKRASQNQPVKVVKIGAIPDDGYCWRKYGRKPIANTKHPREYYRCGHQGQGCPARKQVQIVSENPTKYGIMYYGHHTCQDISIHDYTSELDHVLNDRTNECPNMLCFGSREVAAGGEQSPGWMNRQECASVIESESSDSIDRWVQELVESDVGGPHWWDSMGGPLVSGEDVEYLMSLVDFHGDLI